MDKINILGYFATAMGLSMMLPQIAKMYRTKSVQDISLFTIFLYLFQSILWTIYGFLISAPPVYVGNAIATLIAVFELYLKTKYQNKI